MNKREQQREERRKQILHCCMEKIITHGYAGMKLRDVAAELSISPGLLFNYFASKEQIYLELVRIGVSGPVSLLEGALAQARPPLEMFEDMAAHVLSYLRDPFVCRMFVLMERAQQSLDVPPAVRAELAGFDMLTPLIPVILEGQRQGTVRQGDPRTLLCLFWSALQGAASIHAWDPSIPLPESGWIVALLRA